MHGVGHRLAIRAFRQAGFEGVAVVPAQADADGAFPTVAFPNPEEKGAIDRSLALAREIKARPRPRQRSRRRPPRRRRARSRDRRLPHAVRQRDRRAPRALRAGSRGHAGPAQARGHDPRLVARCCRAMARDRGRRVRGDADRLQVDRQRGAARARPRAQAFVFGYEEALGYTVGPLVRDKDGIGAARAPGRPRTLPKGRGVQPARPDRRDPRGARHVARGSMVGHPVGRRRGRSASPRPWRRSAPSRLRPWERARSTAIFDLPRVRSAPPAAPRSRSATRAPTSSCSTRRTARASPSAPAAPSPRSSSTSSWWDRRRTRVRWRECSADLDRRGLELKARLLSRLGLA